jgi:hypothetical protein
VLIGVELEEDAREQEIAVVQAALDEFEVYAYARPIYVREGRGGGPQAAWIIWITVPFLAAFAAEAGKDAYHGLRRLVSRLFASRHDRGYVVIEDRASKMEVVITLDTPPDAIQGLVSLDLGSFPPGTEELVYDAASGRWVPSDHRVSPARAPGS